MKKKKKKKKDHNKNFFNMKHYFPRFSSYPLPKILKFYTCIQLCMFHII